MGVPPDLAREVGYTSRDAYPGGGNLMYVPCPNNTQEKIEEEIRQRKFEAFEACGTPFLSPTRSQMVLHVEDYPKKLIPIFSAKSPLLYKMEVEDVQMDFEAQISVSDPLYLKSLLLLRTKSTS